MKGFSFLDSRPDDVNQALIGIVRETVVASAVEGKIIQDDDLAFIPEVLPLLVDFVGALRDDLYSYHNEINKQLQLPIVNNCFCYSFAKGAESAYLWNESSDGKIEFGYRKSDALSGAAGAQVSEEFSMVISHGMQLSYNVFCDFQNNLLANPKYGFAQGGSWLADAIACAFFWSTQVGVDYGMNWLGFR